MSSTILLPHARSVRAGWTYHSTNSTYLPDNPLDTQPVSKANTRGPDNHFPISDSSLRTRVLLLSVPGAPLGKFETIVIFC